MKHRFKKLLWLPLVVIATFVAALFTPVAANATTYTWGPWNTYSEKVIRGGAVQMLAWSGADHCPAGPPQQVYAVVTDSSNQTWNIQLPDTIGTQGEFASSMLKVPASASIGTASVGLICVSGGAVTRTFESAPLLIHDGNSNIHVVRAADLGGTITVTIDADDDCPAGNWVAFQVESTDIAPDGYGGTNFESVLSLVDSSTGANGSWTWNITLNSEPQGMESGHYTAGKSYVVKPRCYGGVGGTTNHTLPGRLFTVVGDGYVAMGDSYSSGEGSFNYDLPSGNDSRCHRSTSSYPYWLVDNSLVNPPTFAACSGAVTDDLYLGLGGEDEQLSHLTSNTEKVTLTIGGNDVGFSDVVKACVHHLNTDPTIGWSCANDTNMTSKIAASMSALAGSAEETVYTSGGRPIHSISSILESIEQASPDAKILIGGYPRLFGTDSANYTYDGDAPGAYKCVVHDSFPEVSVSLWDAEWLNDKADELNLIIEDAVDNAPSNIDVTFVDPVPAFAGHGLCGSSVSFINPIFFKSGTTDPKPESFHPNLSGILLGYGSSFAAKL